MILFSPCNNSLSVSCPVKIDPTVFPSMTPKAARRPPKCLGPLLFAKPSTFSRDTTCPLSLSMSSCGPLGPVSSTPSRQRIRAAPHASRSSSEMAANRCSFDCKSNRPPRPKTTRIPYSKSHPACSRPS